MSKSDTDLSQGYARGEEWAFTEIHRKFSGVFHRYLLQRVQSPEVAEELTQEVFLKIFRFRTRYRPELRLDTWLWAVAKNALRDLKRRGRNEPLPLPADLAAAGPVEVPDHKNSENTLIALERRRLWKTMLHLLTAPQRKVLELRLLQQLSYSQIALQLGMSLAAVKCLAYRGRATLIEQNIDQISSIFPS